LNEYKTIAAIDIGSNKISMAIAEISPDGNVRFIEDVKIPSSIGKDTFNEGRISAETIYETCDTLKKFSQLMKDYGIVEHVAVATSGMREAENSEYIIEQIRIKTSIKVKIINNAQERFFSYMALRSSIKEKKSLRNKPVLVINISSGGVEVSAQRNGKLIFTEYLKLGSLRLRETLADLESMTIDYPAIMEEFIESKLYLLKPLVNSMKIKHFIGLGGELNTIIKIIEEEISTDEEINYIKLDTLGNLYKKIRRMSSNQIMDMYDISKNEAEILLPSVILFNTFIKMTKAEGILAPVASHRHGVIYDIADKMSNGSSYVNDDAIISVWKIARKYGVDKKHASFVAKMALSIFDQTMEINQLSNKDRLYLQVAAILHDAGNYVGFTNHEQHSYNIINMQSLLGFSDEELNIIANIAYYHASKLPSRQHSNYVSLSDQNKIRVSKLAAILKFAESMDSSHTQKINKLEMIYDNNVLTICIYAIKDIILEKWFIEENLEFYEEVTGVRLEIRIRR